MSWCSCGDPNCDMPKPATKEKPRRFFFHYNKRLHRATIHWNGVCIPVDDIRCYVPTQTKWNKRQPRFVVQGKAKNVEITDVGGRIFAEVW